MTPLIASRAAAVDVYSMQSVSGAHLVNAAGKIARWTGGAASLALPARSEVA